MKKSLVAVAVTCALASMSALADDGNVSIYGKADLAVGSIGNGLTTNTQVVSNITKIGFKGSEDLGNGTSAIWQIEQQIDIDNASTATAATNNSNHYYWAGRNSFLGLKSETIGTFMLGRHDSPYKESTRGFDPFNDQFADNRHLMGGSTNGANGAAYMDMRPGDSIMYVSPSFGGAKVELQYVPGAEASAQSTDQKGNMTSAALMYSQGKEGLSASVAMQNIKYGTAGTGQFGATGALAAGDSLKGTRLGVGYSASQFMVGFVYEKLTSNIALPAVGHTSNQLGRTDMSLSGQFNIDDSNNIQLAYTKAGNTDNISNTGATEISFGFNHYLSKKTNVYVQYAKINNNSAADYQFNSASTNGVTYAQVPGAGGVPLTAQSTVGKSPSGILVGMRTYF